MYLKLKQEDTWHLIKLSDHVTFSDPYSDPTYGYVLSEQAPDIGLVLWYDTENMWVPVFCDYDLYLLPAKEEIIRKAAVSLDGDLEHRLELDVRLLRYVHDKETDHLYLFDGRPAFLLNDDGKTLERV